METRYIMHIPRLKLKLIGQKPIHHKGKIIGVDKKYEHVDSGVIYKESDDSWVRIDNEKGTYMGRDLRYKDRVKTSHTTDRYAGKVPVYNIIIDFGKKKLGGVR